MNEYVEYRYHHGENPSGAAAERLACLIARKLSDVTTMGSVCDLGCGNGYLSRKLARQGLDVTGVDASVSGIQYAESHADSGVKYICGEIRPDGEWTGTIDKFDLVVSSEVIEHLYRPADLIETTEKIIKPGGLFLITTPYHGYWKNVAMSVLGRFDRHFDPLWDGGHIKFFSVSTLAELVGRYDFTDIRFSYSGRCPGLWKNMVCMSNRAL